MLRRFAVTSELLAWRLILLLVDLLLVHHGSIQILSRLSVVDGLRDDCRTAYAMLRSPACRSAHCRLPEE